MIAQEETSAEVLQMPRSAIATGDVDAVLSLVQSASPEIAMRASAYGTAWLTDVEESLMRRAPGRAAGAVERPFTTQKMRCIFGTSAFFLNAFLHNVLCVCTIAHLFRTHLQYLTDVMWI